MAQETIEGPVTRHDDCTPAQRVTRSLLGYGVIAGPVYVGVTLAQALTRDGFDLEPAPVEPARQRCRTAGCRSRTSCSPG